jgi:hypothetical protein
MAVFHDTRFVTPNTNLASCLGALGVPLKNVVSDGKVFADYARVIKDAETGKTVVFWSFEMEGDNVEARRVEKWWRERAEFEAEFPTHPLVYMRRALEKLEWVTKVWHGNIIPPIRRKANERATDDLFFAACAMASGYELADFDRLRKVYSFDSECLTIKDDFVNFRTSQVPVAFMRRVLEVRKLLLAELKRPDLRTLINYKHGDPLENGKEMFVIEGSKQEDIDRLLNAFYA